MLTSQRLRHIRTCTVEKAKLRLTRPSSWTLPKQPSSIAPPHVWSNSDQDPVPPHKRTWTGTTFVMYWFSDFFAVTGWSAASAIMTTGLTTTDAILIILVAALCNAIPTVLNGAIGADLHISFPVIIRASYGYWLSYFCVISRGVLALFWFGIHTTYGSECITLIITSIWPSYADIPNHLPPSAHITTKGMVSYFIYSVFSFPFLMVPTHKLQYLFWTKSILVPPTALAMVIWVSVQAGGAGEFFHEPASVHGAERAWTWLSTLTAATGSLSTLTVNIPDFSRFSKKPGSQLWQLPFIPFFKLIVGVFGIITASASKKLYGETLWSPLAIIAKWQGTPGGRAAAFFAALVWLIAQICANISSNALSFANDITTLAPKWFDIRRGCVFVFLVGGWALCPWIVLQSAKSFLSFMAAYAVFMSAFAGIMATDYWVIKGRRYDVPAMYDPHGIYRYWNGVNWRALAVTVVVVVPLLPGLANKVAPEKVKVSAGMEHLFAFSWIYGFCTTCVLYYVLNVIWPDESTLVPCVVQGLPEPAGSQVENVEEAREEGKKTDVTQTKGVSNGAPAS